MRPTVVYTAGCFDLLHRGHLNFLWASRKLGDILVVGVVSDSGIYAYKDRWPSESFGRRRDRIARIGFVDLAVRQAGTDPTENLLKIRPDIFTHGDDWSELKEGHATLTELGVEYVTIPYTEGVSSTMLREGVGA
jgi:cytidyltransferase-like protein